LINEIARTDHATFKHELQFTAKLLDAVATKILQEQVRFNACELDLLADLLERSDRDLQAEIGHTDHRAFKQILVSKQALLASARSKLIEAGDTAG